MKNLVTYEKGQVPKDYSRLLLTVVFQSSFTNDTVAHNNMSLTCGTIRLIISAGHWVFTRRLLWMRVWFSYRTSCVDRLFEWKSFAFGNIQPWMCSFCVFCSKFGVILCIRFLFCWMEKIVFFPICICCYERSIIVFLNSHKITIITGIRLNKLRIME